MRDPATKKEWLEQGRRLIFTQRKTVTPYWVLLLGALGIALLPIWGCATAPAESETKVCFIKPMGQTQNGMLVVAQSCMSPEAFAESQK